MRKTLHTTRWSLSIVWGLALLLLTAAPILAADTIQVITPADLGTGDGQWHVANQRDDGLSQITATQPDQHGGAGSLEQSLPDPAAPPPKTAGYAPKTDFQIIKQAGFGLLGQLDALGFDWYRAASSTAPGHLTPALRVLVYDPDANDSYLLVWEGVYNGYPSNGPAVPVDTWVTEDVLADNFWRVPQFIDGVFKGISTCVDGVTDPADPTACFVFDRGLGDWGLGPNTLVVGLEVGIGSGWAGSYLSFADYVRLGFGGNTTIYDFEPTAAGPGEGFVTGGGWFLDPNAPQGTKNPKVTFGLNAMQLPGSTELHGSLQVNIHTTKLKFHANTINLLVVDPAAGTAQIEGEGTLKSPGGPKQGDALSAKPPQTTAFFRMQVVDGDPDQIQLQIYTLEGGVETTVYDSGGLVELNGGNITIHTETATQEDITLIATRVTSLLAQAEFDAGLAVTDAPFPLYIPMLSHINP
jgi:hypothetical protein